VVVIDSGSTDATRAVKREIAAALPGSSHQGFLLSYTDYFLGRRLRELEQAADSPS
jgi:glycosyltransferase involved in cell wall biosynthesis